jgi:carbon storage regulator
MSIISRQIGETLRIGDDIVITILHLRGDLVRLRVSAPENQKVYRKEIIDELHESARQALSPVSR